MGKDGVVFQAFTEYSEACAIKVYRKPRLFYSELLVYGRLSEHQVTSIRGHAVPQLLGWDEELLLIQMSIVEPPFVLDFAGARLDEKVAFDSHVTEWHTQRIYDLFEDNAPTVFGILDDLWRKYGIWHDDISVRNIRFEGMREA